MEGDSPPDATIVANDGPTAPIEEDGFPRMRNMRKTIISRILVYPVDYWSRTCVALNETRNAHERHRCYIGNDSAKYETCVGRWWDSVEPLRTWIASCASI